MFFTFRVANLWLFLNLDESKKAFSRRLDGKNRIKMLVYIWSGEFCVLVVVDGVIEQNAQRVI